MRRRTFLRASAAPVIAGLTGAAARDEPGVLLRGARLFDGTGMPVLENSAILIRGNRIELVGPAGSFPVPSNSRQIDATGKTVVPGLVDHHFHLDPRLVPLFLARGVTSLRDPGQWIEAYEPVREWMKTHGLRGPRLLLTGPALDGANPAYPGNAMVLLGAEEARIAVRRLAAQGATALKVYFRLPLDCVQAVAGEARRAGIPVAAHLEVVRAEDAVAAGVRGLVHVTSLGPSLVPAQEAERYRQAVLADSNARALGRYRMWASIDPQSEKAWSLARFLATSDAYVDPTLAVFEKQADREGVENRWMAAAWKNMVAYTGVLHRAGVRLVVGSHSSVPYAPPGLAYHRELELLVEAGLTPAEALMAATRVGAQMLGGPPDLGTIQPSKLADLVVLEADPLTDIRNARRVSAVVADGQYLEPNKITSLPAISGRQGK
ncbi:MAG: amidohydrolase family protein [Bryobacteraceae bacterium]